LEGRAGRWAGGASRRLIRKARLNGGSPVQIGGQPDGSRKIQRPNRYCEFFNAARRPEKPFESTAEIIPGDRGKDGGSWCRYPL